MYVTFGPDGQPVDVGLRGKTSANVSLGPVKASVSGPESSLNLIGAFAPAS